MMYADCSATLENADMVTNVVLRILPVIPSSLLVVKLPLSLALTFKTTELVSMGTTAAFLTRMLMLQKNQMQMVLLAMQEIVVAVEEEEEEEGGEVVVVDEDEVVAVEDVGRLLHLLHQPQVPLELLLLQMPLLKRGMMRSK